MLKRYFVTFILVVTASMILYSQYLTYTQNPWTRDGQIRAYVIQITPRVTGQINRMNIEDNAQVKKGDVLFEIDASVYNNNLKKAIAGQKQALALLNKAKNEERRSLNLVKRTPGAIPTLTLNNLHNAVETAQANVFAADALIDEAQLNLTYTKITAPTDGYITNLSHRVGSQVVANTPVVALIDQNSFWVEGFFKETDLKNVKPTDKALVTLMMHDDLPLEGEIKSIGYGIAKQDGSTGNALLPNVNPNFQWIRLAQRIPVKIHLNNTPQDLQLRVGMTASIKIMKNKTTE
ncbi:HlyD family secretion protein [Photobacterium sanguinicancri]|uniref:HlyD family secretion protein n=1 Tax=Photobacterium sanguinicancri TaxID=875932 RepID=A0AAW7Y9G3_9GAMM|nr:HlyD family secretion protein [Photobacterium sanguinicancri]KXI24529.1 hemolysin D [Photobacterium sanguinicancri]MDO6544876.1 HlyD family secretion protein [Photobacterium sanguinicancri]